MWQKSLFWNMYLLFGGASTTPGHGYCHKTDHFSISHSLQWSLNEANLFNTERSARADSVYKHSDILQQTSEVSEGTLYDQINYL